MISSFLVAAVVTMMPFPVAARDVCAQKKPKAVQIIRGAPVKKSAPAELPPETKSIPVSEVPQAQVKAVDAKAEADTAADDEAATAKAKKSAAQQRAIEEHGQNVQHEFNNATNALAGQ